MTRRGTVKSGVGQGQHGFDLEGSDWISIGGAGPNRIAQTHGVPIRLASHNTFGNGPHKCVGAPLARVEIQVFLQEFLPRIGEFRLDPDFKDTEHAGSVPGFDELHLRWD